MNNAGVSINCISLRGKLAKIEVMGSKALEVLQKLLHPVTWDAENFWHLKNCSYKDSDMRAHAKKLFIPEDISSSTIISLTVCDPRNLPEKKVELGLEKGPTSKESHLEKLDDKSMELLLSFLPKVEGGCLVPDNFELWEANQVILPPMEENILCMEKQQHQLAFFRIGNTNSEKLRASAEGLSCRLCPIMLLNGSENKGSISRWSIVLPISWVKPFWNCLVSRGAHAIGLKEKHWVASEARLPCFPMDFPDCNSYSCYMATKAVASEETLKLRPLAMRPFSIPIPPPYPKFYRPKARTSKILDQFLGEIRGEHLLLFPFSLDIKNNIAKFMKNDDRLKERPHEAAPLINYCKRLCFLRVGLEAYRGGVFEEGAVVCAPHYSDITSCRTDGDKEEIQVSQSSVRSYFQQQPSGKWELQILEDPVPKASHRLPIGFITSGFVPGSKKPSATALCEASLLARLREEQWNKTTMKSRRKEIYVLVRNLRSTTYRLALATIVLELQENDLAFI